MCLTKTLLLVLCALSSASAIASDKPPKIAIKCGVQTSLASDQRLAHIPTWTTRSEVESAGFDVFRGEREKGPFKKLNAEPIKAAHFSAKPKEYEFRDDTIDPCKTYFYYVEAISTTGYREKVTGVLKAIPKNQAKPTGEGK
jgi:hypothetical protein